jgi:hypothetical protein
MLKIKYFIRSTEKLHIVFSQYVESYKQVNLRYYTRILNNEADKKCLALLLLEFKDVNINTLCIYYNNEPKKPLSPVALFVFLWAVRDHGRTPIACFDAI